MFRLGRSMWLVLSERLQGEVTHGTLGPNNLIDTTQFSSFPSSDVTRKKAAGPRWCSYKMIPSALSSEWWWHRLASTLNTNPLRYEWWIRNILLFSSGTETLSVFSPTAKPDLYWSVQHCCPLKTVVSLSTCALLEKGDIRKC